MQIGCTVTDTGLLLRIDERTFPLNFPADVWRAFPDKELLADNFAFLKALHLPEMLDRWEPLEFDTCYPLFKHQITSMMINSIPFYADVDSRSTAESLRRFLGLDIRFRDYNVRYPAASQSLRDHAVLNISFGKDSLLTYAVAREMGLPLTLIMSVENDCPIEYGHKREIAKRFSEEFDEKILIVENDSGVIHRYGYWGAPHTSWGIGHIISEYLFNSLPFALHFDARYIVMGNEKSCDSSYTSREGYLCYPVFDQSSEWMLEMTKMASALAGDRLHVMSLIEPLHDLAITRILHSRYPEIGKFQMSCFPDENEYGKAHFWCGHCTKCARIFLFFQAHGFDPQQVGLNTDMFQAEFQDLYAVFGRKITVGRTMGYDASPCGRDEQLLAFYLALERGARGALIDLFREECLEEARAREDELRGLFLKVQPTRSLPAPYAERAKAIYAEALAD